MWLEMQPTFSNLKAYAAFAGSISPNIMVASLLPVKTAT